MYIKYIRPFSVVAPNGPRNKTNRFKAICKVISKPTHMLGEARAVYFFCVKVNDNASTETISVEKL